MNEEELRKINHTPVLGLVAADRIARLVHEVRRLRQGMWDALVILGVDTDGDTGPEAIASDMVPWLLSEVQEYKNDALQNSDQIEVLQEALIAARAELSKWGWGDMHYGTSRQESSILDVLLQIDSVLGTTPPVLGPEHPSRPDFQPIHQKPTNAPQNAPGSATPDLRIVE